MEVCLNWGMMESHEGKKKRFKITWRKYGRHVDFSAIAREALSVLCRIAPCNCYAARILIPISSSAQPRKSLGRKIQLKKRWRLQNCPIRHLHISHNAPYVPPKTLHKLCFQFLLGWL